MAQQVKRPQFAMVVATLAVVVAGKQYFRTATADDLRWLLAPTARCVSVLTGTHFTHVAGAGYVDRDISFVIAPVCAGLNFMLAAILALAVGWHKPGEGTARSNAAGGAKVNDKPGEGTARSNAAGGAKVNDKPGEGTARSNAAGGAKVNDKPGEGTARSNAAGGAKVNDKPGEGTARSNAAGGAKVNDKPGEGTARSNAAGGAKVNDVTTWRATGMRLIGIVAAAYAATIVVNTARISLSIETHAGGELHRLEGILVYLGGLCAVYAIARRGELSSKKMLAIPFVAYLVITLLLPLCHGASSRPDFAAHSMWVLGGCAALAIIAMFVNNRTTSGVPKRGPL